MAKWLAGMLGLCGNTNAWLVSSGSTDTAACVAHEMIVLGERARLHFLC